MRQGGFTMEIINFMRSFTPRFWLYFVGGLVFLAICIVGIPAVFAAIKEVHMGTQLNKRAAENETFQKELEVTHYLSQPQIQRHIKCGLGRQYSKWLRHQGFVYKTFRNQ